MRSNISMGPRWYCGKEPTCQCRKLKKHWFNPCVGKTPWRGNGNPLWYSCLENPMDRGPWQTIVHWVLTKSQTWLKWLRAQHNISMGFPGSLDDRESTCNVRDLGSIPGSGRFCGEGNGNPLQFSCLGNSMGRWAWLSIAQRIRHNWTANTN